MTLVGYAIETWELRSIVTQLWHLFWLLLVQITASVRTKLLATTQLSSGFTSKLLLYPNPRWLNSNKCLPVSTWERLILNLGSGRILSFESDCKIKIIWQFYPWGREIKNLRYSLWAQKFFWLWRLNFFWNVEFTLKSFFSGGRSFKGPQTTFLSLKDFRHAIPKPSKL